MWYKNVGGTFFRFVTIHAFDRRTDRQKGLTIPCVALHAVVIIFVIYCFITQCLVVCYWHWWNGTLQISNQ